MKQPRLNETAPEALKSFLGDIIEGFREHLEDLAEMSLGMELHEAFIKRTRSLLQRLAQKCGKL